MIAYIPCDHHHNRNTFVGNCDLCQVVDLTPIIEAHKADELIEMLEATKPVVKASQLRKHYPKLVP